MDLSPLFRCPCCQGALTHTSKQWSCVSCRSEFPLRHGLPDFRTGAAVDVHYEDDLKLVMAPGSTPNLTTPNRFSLTTEPHVGL